MSKQKKKVKEKVKVTAGQIMLLSVLILITLLALVMILMVFSAAFKDEESIIKEGFSLIPRKFSLSGFNAVMKYGKQLLVSYGVTIFITVAGTVLGLLFMSMCAHALTIKEFPLRKFMVIFIVIPMLFSGGQLSTYIIYTSVYKLKDSLILLFLPMTVSTMQLIILRTYIQSSIPAELVDAAKLDGAGDYRIFFTIVLPLMKPALAAVGFMKATAYWNDWMNALLYITSDSKKPLQMLLIGIQKTIEALLNIRNIPANVLAAMNGRVPQYSATMSTVVVVIGPIILAYPFFQKYFIKGLTIGAIKG